MTLLSKLALFARSPQGRRATRKAMQFAQSPEGRRKIAQVQQRLASRRAKKIR